MLLSSTLTVDEVLDADSIIEYSYREGTKIANRTATLDTIDAYWGPITVKKKEVQTLTATTEGELINAVNQINNSKDTIIKLGADIKLTKFLGFNVLGNVTLDLAGNTLDVSEHNLTFYYGYKDENNYNFRSNLTIKDSGNGNSGKIVGVGFNGRVRLSTLDMTEELKNLPKTYGFTIDGGTYAVTGTNSWDEYIFDVLSDSEPMEQNITINVNVKKGVFEVGKVDGEIFYFPSSDETNMKANFNFETLMVKGLGVKLGSNILAEKRINEVIPNDTKLYYTTDTNQVIELEDKATLVRNVRTSTNAIYPQYIKLAKETGLSVNNVTLPNVTFGYTVVPEATINITNIGAAELKITNVTVSDTDKFEINISSQPTIGIGATNTDFKIKAKTGLSAGTYTPTITVTDENGKTYTATVTLKVEQKQLTGLGISGLDGTWVYGTTKTPTATGVDGLGAGDYEITYSKLNNGSYEDIGTTLPKLVGKYKATLSITNQNYTASDASVYFEITPNNTEVKVKSYDETFTYDGTEHTKNAYDVLWANNASPVTDNKLPNGDKVTAEITGKVRDVKDTALENNTIGKITITNAEGVDVTDCYSNKVKAAGKLTVNPITTLIVVTADSDTKVYNGTELTKNTYTYTDGVLLSGDMLEVAITGSQKFVGSSNNTVSNVKVMRNGEDITDNYTMGTHVNGVLEVTSAEQPLAIADQYVKVNGFISKGYLEQSVTGNVGNIDFTIKSGTALTYDNINDEFVAGATAGDVVMTVTAVKVDLGGDNTPEWKETSKDFTVHVVNKENVTITGLEDNQVFTFDNTTKTPWETGTITVEDNKVDVNELEIFYNGTGSTTYSSKFAPVDAGTYTITYKVKDSNPNYVGSVTYTFTIKKAQLDKVTIVKDTFEYTGSDITPTLNNVNSNIEVTGDTQAKNVSNNTIVAKIKDKANYEWKDESNGDLTINWSITQATPDYTVPTGLTSVKGKVLADVVLPTGFTWNAPATVLTVGKTKYKATFTPVDTTNYKTITDIDIEVDVKNTFDVITSVDGGNGTITPSKIGAVEGTKFEITFTPNTGYMIDKVLVNTVETTVTGNKIELTVNEEKEVKVSYKLSLTHI